jgi:hypothetical protein
MPPPSNPKEARVLGDELQRDPLQHANNAVTLLACLQDPQQQQEVSAAVTIDGSSSRTTAAAAAIAVLRC